MQRAKRLLPPEVAAAQAERGRLDHTLLSGSLIFELSDAELLGDAPVAPSEASLPTPNPQPRTRRQLKRVRTASPGAA